MYRFHRIKKFTEEPRNAGCSCDTVCRASGMPCATCVFNLRGVYPHQVDPNPYKRKCNHPHRPDEIFISLKDFAKESGAFEHYVLPISNMTDKSGIVLKNGLPKYWRTGA